MSDGDRAHLERARAAEVAERRERALEASRRPAVERIVEGLELGEQAASTPASRRRSIAARSARPSSRSELVSSGSGESALRRRCDTWDVRERLDRWRAEIGA
ncbi:MAG: hypothetical protein M5U28_00365 [Sandaracinaceae bacterium]|nr:hypothetical protein [Sandaracinaceae bacterium]